MNKLGEQVKALRKAMHWSQEDLAREIIKSKRKQATELK
jgi:transcriptional regulator with XRE-family HTH domain